MFGSIDVMWKCNVSKSAQVNTPQERLDGMVCLDFFSYIKNIGNGGEIPVSYSKPWRRILCLEIYSGEK
jgi:hypothetical protein